VRARARARRGERREIERGEKGGCVHWLSYWKYSQNKTKLCSKVFD